jgi:hypothetical protein
LPHVLGATRCRNPWKKIRLIRRGENYNLERIDTQGTFSAIRLSAANILAMMPLIHEAYAQLLQSQTTPDLTAAGGIVSVSHQVDDFAAGTSLLDTRAMLAIATRYLNYSFEFPTTALARRLAARLLEECDKVEAKQKPPIQH